MAEDAVLHSLCLEQMAPWLGSPVSRGMAEEVGRHLNETVRSVFLLRFSGGEVALLEKPGFRVLETFNDSSRPEPDEPVIYREEFIRSHMYRDFFERVMASSNSSVDAVVAIDVNDAPITSAVAPVFAFQKPRLANTVLIPDVDFLHANFYIPSDYRDDTPYGEKMSRAIFAGSTTGGRTITAEDVRTLDLPRLRSGVFFKGSDLVDFRLPRIVQCESPEVAEMIAALGVNNEPCGWSEQFQYRFILSMDGNGATCSRVVIGLMSQSALFKYESPHLLYYFGAMVPWRHYVPIGSDAEVAPLVEAERRHPKLFESVADEGRNFARRYLGRAGTCAYTSQLLQHYQSCLVEGRRRHAEPPAPVEEPAAAPALQLVEVGAHIQSVGDVWGWPGEWVGDGGSGHAVEAIAVVPCGIPADALSYQVVLDDDTLSASVQGGAFCGTRGKNRPLRGFQLQLRGDVSGQFDCSYSGRFTDGSVIGPVGAGELCGSPNGAPLESFEIIVSERPAR